MKAKAKTIVGVLAVLAFLLSCGGREERFAMPDSEAHQALSEIDSLMWRQPDSAFAVLRQFLTTTQADSLDEFDGHYIQLLISELLYKNYYGQSNREGLLHAVDYFDSLVECGIIGSGRLFRINFVEGSVSSLWSVSPSGFAVPNSELTSLRASPFRIITFLDARAHYIKGVGCYELDSLVKACEEYLRAVEIMEERFEEKDLIGDKAQFMALAYTKPCVLFRNQYLHEQAVYFGKKSLAYYKRASSSPWHLSWILDEIGSQYHAMGQLDSAANYYHKALEALPDTNNITYRDIETILTILSYDRGSDAESVLERLHRLRSQAVDKCERVSRSANIGEIYFREGLYDSAWVNLYLAFHQTTSVPTKKQAAEWLVQIGRKSGQHSTIQEELDFLASFATQDENLGGLKSQLTGLYGSYLNTRTELSHRKHNSLLFRRLWGITGVVVVLTILLIQIQRNRKRGFEAQLSREQAAYKESIGNMKELLTESEEALRFQKEKARRLQSELAKHQRKWGKRQLIELLDEDICREIAESLQGKVLKRDQKSDAYPELWLSDHQLSRLENAVEKHFQGFVSVLSDKYPKIKTEEIHQCMLCLMNLDDTQIAALLHCDYSTVKKRSYKLKTFFGTKKELQVYLKEL